MFVIDPFFNGLVPGRNFVVPIWILAGKRFSGGPPVEMTALLVGIIFLLFLESFCWARPCVLCWRHALTWHMGMGMGM